MQEFWVSQSWIDQETGPIKKPPAEALQLWTETLFLILNAAKYQGKNNI
jgi:hypothetical protein